MSYAVKCGIGSSSIAPLVFSMQILMSDVTSLPTTLCVFAVLRF